MNYQGAMEARKNMKVPCEIIRVPQVKTLNTCICFHIWEENYREEDDAYVRFVCLIEMLQGGHFVFIDNPSGFHSAMLYACRKFISQDSSHDQQLPDGLQLV